MRRRRLFWTFISMVSIILSGCGGEVGSSNQDVVRDNSPKSGGDSLSKPDNTSTKNSGKNKNETQHSNLDNSSNGKGQVDNPTLKNEKISKFVRIPVNDPLNPPEVSISFSFRDALVGEPILAIVEFSEDVEPIDNSSFRVSGATLKEFKRVTPKLYRLILMPSSSANFITVELDKTSVVDSDGESAKEDAKASASIAKAPWATKLRRYRGTIEATLSYQNSNSQKIDIPLLWIRAGEFDMGCSGFDEKHCDSDETPHQVTLSKGFWLGRTEITQWQWYVVMGQNPSYFNATNQSEQEKLPVESITYDEAKEFTKRVLQGYKAKANLPTDAEWEYAIRSTTTTAYYDNPDDIVGDANSKAAYYIGWYAGNSSEWRYKKVTQPQPSNGVDLSNLYSNFYTKPTSTFGTHYIMQKANSDWRLKDMAGNVAEWCRDYYQADLGGDAQIDPTGPSTGNQRVVRGGSWYDPAVMLRSASREGLAPDTKSNRVGFRIAIYPEEVK